MSEYSLRWRSFLVPKVGHAPDECEDAAAGDPATGRFAVADGASESYAAGDWARLLVETFVDSGPVGDWLKSPRTQWNDRVGAGAVSWYAEEKLSLGGHATFIGVSVQPSAGGLGWTAFAVGDACLFHFRAGRCLVSFPLEHSSEFTGGPPLVHSRGGTPMWNITHGEFHRGDSILLTTDALAQHVLSAVETGDSDPAGLLGLDEEDDLAMWVAMARESGRLRNDDVALGIIERVDGP